MEPDQAETIEDEQHIMKVIHNLCAFTKELLR